MSVKTYTRNFVGGEITSEFYGAIGDGRHASGLAKARNVIIAPHGPAVSRPGFRMTRETKTPAQSAQCRLIPFIFNTEQAVVVEFTHQQARFYTDGAVLLDGSGNPLTVTTPYASADLPLLQYDQAGDVLKLYHQGYLPRDLTRLGPTSWALTFADFSGNPYAPNPISVVATPGTTPSGGIHHHYTVTSVVGGLESDWFTAPTVTNNLLDTGAFNTISWSAPSGIPAGSSYRIYKFVSGVWAFIGETTSLSFVDDNITPNLGITKPILNRDLWGTSERNSPGTSASFEQRRWFAGDRLNPSAVYATRTGTEVDMSYTIPPKDDNSLEFKIKSRDSSLIRHLVPMNDLIALTASSAQRITSSDGGPVTPSSINIRPQSSVGANYVKPLLIASNMVYAAARGGHVVEFGYSNDRRGYLAGDLSLRAPHLFKKRTIKDMAFQQAPHPVVWAVSSNGHLLGLTYVPEQEVASWHRHDTAGSFEAVCCIPEGDTDAVYVSVIRTFNGTARRFIERMDSTLWDPAEEDDDEDGNADPIDASECFCVDCGATYRGSPTATISGLSWLNGQTVSILADGAVHPQRVVAGGQITLVAPASVVHVGLPYTVDMKGLPLYIEGERDFGTARPKSINRVFLRLKNSGGVKVGGSLSSLAEIKQRQEESYGESPKLLNGVFESATFTAGWAYDAQWCLRQTDPLPVKLLNITVEAAVGG